ncbi:hypothetical protein [Borborobacter arsenicus]|uniref:hypothetical protein n=1 Tax=Borborobacter arsenicus TaxID=1851146 RepID=UPI001404DED9|nr:hypothetical protein [Pseudaminobacter arsenicus]
MASHTCGKNKQIEWQSGFRASTGTRRSARASASTNPLAILKADIGNWRTKVPETRTRAIAPFVKLSKGLRSFARRLGLVGVSRNLDIARSFCATGYGDKERQGEE